MKSQNNNKKTVAVDLDGTLTQVGYFVRLWEMSFKELDDFYSVVKPNLEIIAKVNGLYRQGHTINIFTSRWDVFQSTTEDWLKKYKVRYTALHMNKPFYNFLIDDKAVNLNEIDKIYEKLRNKR